MGNMLKHPSSIKTEQTTSENISYLKKKKAQIILRLYLVQINPRNQQMDSFFGATKLENAQRAALVGCLPLPISAGSLLSTTLKTREDP